MMDELEKHVFEGVQYEMDNDDLILILEPALAYRYIDRLGYYDTIPPHKLKRVVEKSASKSSVEKELYVSGSRVFVQDNMTGDVPLGEGYYAIDGNLYECEKQIPATEDTDTPRLYLEGISRSAEDRFLPKDEVQKRIDSGEFEYLWPIWSRTAF